MFTVELVGLSASQTRLARTDLNIQFCDSELAKEMKIVSVAGPVKCFRLKVQCGQPKVNEIIARVALAKNSLIPTIPDLFFEA